MRLDATQVQLASEVVRTSDDIRRRYQENRHWRLYPKEWIYKNILLQDKDVLDFGCGTGEITTQLAFLGARHVYALDVTQGLLDATQRRAELDGVADRVETVYGMVQDVKPRPVDVIISVATLHHCFPLENVMPALMRWLKPGGVFVAVEPASYWGALKRLRNHFDIPGDALDEGERELNAADLRYVASHISEPQIVHFHVLGRLSRLWPKGDLLYRRIDQLVLRAPMASKLAGQALIVGHR